MLWFMSGRCEGQSGLPPSPSLGGLIQPVATPETRGVPSTHRPGGRGQLPTCGFLGFGHARFGIRLLERWSLCSTVHAVHDPQLAARRRVLLGQAPAPIPPAPSGNPSRRIVRRALVGGYDGSFFGMTPTLFGAPVNPRRPRARHAGRSSPGSRQPVHVRGAAHSLAAEAPAMPTGATSWIQPNGSGRVPYWMPISSSKSRSANGPVPPFATWRVRPL